MNASQNRVVLAALVLFAGASFVHAPFASALSFKQEAQQSNSSRPVGSVKAISGNAITLTTDAGPEVNVLVQGTTRVLRVAPGEKDLKNAVPMTLAEVQAGDRVLVRGNLS